MAVSSKDNSRDSTGAGGRTDERAIERSLNNVSERLQAAEQSARGANGSTAEENLDRTRQLADSLDSLRRRLDERAAGRNGQQQGNQQGQQQGNNRVSSKGSSRANKEKGQQGRKASRSGQKARAVSSRG